MEPMNPYQTPNAEITFNANQEGNDKSSPFSPSGRFGRLSYVAWNMLLMIPVMIAVFAVVGVSGMSRHGSMPAMIWIIDLIVMVPMFIFTIRRLHDFDSSGWWALLFLVPIANFILALVLWFKPGTQGTNRFADPRITLGWEKVLGYIAIGFGVLYIVGIVAAIGIAAIAGSH